MSQSALLTFKMVEEATTPTMWSRWRSVLLPGLVVFLLSLPVFARLCGCDPHTPYTDYPGHFNFALRIGNGGEKLPHALFHYCLLALMGGPNGFPVAKTAAVLLALMWGARAILTAFLLRGNATVSQMSLIVLSLALGVVMTLPNWWKFPSIYLGQLSPNVWHNPTTLFTIPLILLVFILGNRALESPSLLRVLLVGVAIALSILAKPNYAIAYMPCLALGLFIMFCTRHYTSMNWSGLLLRLVLALAPGVLVLGGQFVSTFGKDTAEKSSVVFNPFTVWSLYSPHILASILLSIAFPLFTAACYYRSVLKDRALVIAWATFTVATLQFALLAEKGPRFDHANFAWGGILANHVLFVACAAFLLRQPIGVKRHLAFGVLALHVATGLFCLARCVAHPDFAVRF